MYEEIFHFNDILKGGRFDLSTKGSVIYRGFLVLSLAKQWSKHQIQWGSLNEHPDLSNSETYHIIFLKSFNSFNPGFLQL